MKEHFDFGKEPIQLIQDSTVDWSKVQRLKEERERNVLEYGKHQLKMFKPDEFQKKKP